jgi:hypothetical protein
MTTIKVFELSEHDYWAGESLEACIAAARAECGLDCYEDAETEGREVSPEAMKRLKVAREEGGSDCVTFEEHLAEMVRFEAPETFPKPFAAQDW